MAVGRTYAILFADRVIREDNGKYGCIGLFDQFFTTQVPFPTMPWSFLVGMEGVSPGKHVVTMNLVHDDTQSVVLPVTIEMEQMGEGDVVIPIPVAGLYLPQFGRYTLTVNVDGLPVGSRGVRVMRITERSDLPGGER